VNRLCGSGIEALVQAAHLIQLDEADMVLAGGMENMRQGPSSCAARARASASGVQPQLEDSLFSALRDRSPG
jgi:acetyl-CoA acyltransferase 2